jgi:hypothetical protein
MFIEELEEEVVEYHFMEAKTMKTNAWEENVVEAKV